MDQDVLIDSNVYIDLLRSGRDPGQAIAARYDGLNVVTCGMVQLEVLRGAREQNLKSRLQEVFSLWKIVAGIRGSLILRNEGVMLMHTVMRNAFAFCGWLSERYQNKLSPCQVL